jgi:AcrR family transcriptional regulator
MDKTERTRLHKELICKIESWAAKQLQPYYSRALLNDPLWGVIKRPPASANAPRWSNFGITAPGPDARANQDLLMDTLRPLIWTLAAARHLQKNDDAEVHAFMLHWWEDARLAAAAVTNNRKARATLHAGKRSRLIPRNTERCIAEQLRQGAPPKEVAERCGVSKETVYRRRRELIK